MLRFKPDRRALLGMALLACFALFAALAPLGVADTKEPQLRSAGFLPPVLRPSLVPPDPPVNSVTRPKVENATRLSEVEFTRRLDEAPLTLGAISIGRATRGYLFGGTHMGDSELWHLTDPEHAWGTHEMVSALRTAIYEVARQHEGTHELHIGHLSRRGGGWLRPHRSHQSGRDVDLAFYYKDDSRWYKNADSSNLDVTRTWALLSTLFKTAAIEYVFVDRSLLKLLAEEAARVGEPAEIMRLAFDGDLPRARPVVRHTRGHRNHMHIRFSSPIAVENASRAAVRLGRGARRANGLLRLLALKQRRSLARAEL